MRGGATLWDGAAECQDNFAGCVKTILPAPLRAARTTPPPERPEGGDRPVLARSINDPEATDPQNVLDSTRHDGINIITYMAAPTRRDPKAAALRQHGTLNPRPEAVHDPLFAPGEFFDARDLVQVKYEMLRRARVDGHAVSQSAKAFGFSRPVFYHAQRALARAGLAGLVPQKPGPRRAHKLPPAVMAFLERARAADPALRAPALAQRVQDRFGYAVHPRSIERAFARAEKKRP
jgi:transposase